MKITFNFIMLLSLSLLLGCQQKEMPRQNELPDTTELLTEEEQSTTHTDTHYKYEYRTGNSGDYGYNYDVSGYDIEGNDVTGNISMEDKYGTGTITKSDGEEVAVEVEWVGYGELKATDSDGNEYELTVD